MILAVTGRTGLVFGLLSAVALVVVAVHAQRRPDRSVRQQLRIPVAGMVAGAVVGMAALQLALLTDDFTVRYVAENSSRATPALFKVTAAWSALEGSILLWVLVLAGLTAVVLRQVRSTADRLGTGALAVLGAVGVFFFGLVATVASPFEVLGDPPADGPGPNALLQNNIMVALHPPLLYLGYVGLTIPFAFVISALVLGEVGLEWLRRTRRANLVAWSFLTAGLLLGAWWSYEVLGWGGFWAWDPVENAALLPWLVATAFIHSAVLQLQRGVMRSWNVVLVITAFALTILGTFLTRSSVVASVHSFTQSDVGPALLAFFVLVVTVGLGLFAHRAPHLSSPARLESLRSREGAFLVNNLLLCLLAFVVLLGTLYPVLVEALTGDEVAVGRPYFDRMAVPIGLLLLLTMGVGPFLPYRAASGRVVWGRLRVPALVASAAAAGVVLAGVRSAGVVAVVLLATLLVAASVRQLAASLPDRRPSTAVHLLRARRGYWGGQLAHVGLALVALAVATSADLSERATTTLEVGDSTSFAGYTVTYAGSAELDEGHRAATVARIELRQDGELVHTAEPRLNLYPSQRQAVAAPAVWSTVQQDVYVALSAFEEERVSLTLHRYPLMWLLWAGGLVVAAGGFWALGPRPRRRVGPTAPAPAPAEPTGSVHRE